LSAGLLVEQAWRLGGELAVGEGGKLRLKLPDSPEGNTLLEELRAHRDEVVAHLSSSSTRPWPIPLSYGEYFCRMRAAGFPPIPSSEWETMHESDAECMARSERLCRWGAEGESSTTMTDGRHETAFPACPKCGAYCLYRERHIGPYECQRCGLTGILEADARNAGARKDRLRQEAHA
jgi:predicted RNA-binding Zn-ribbon protein involved in translation (DUF1610 family)